MKIKLFLVILFLFVLSGCSTKNVDNDYLKNMSSYLAQQILKDTLRNNIYNQPTTPEKIIEDEYIWYRIRNIKYKKELEI